MSVDAAFEELNQLLPGDVGRLDANVACNTLDIVMGIVGCDEEEQVGRHAKTCHKQG